MSAINELQLQRDHSMLTWNMFNVIILTPASSMSYEASAVYVPTEHGIEGFLTSHQTDHYALIAGVCRIQVADKEERIAIGMGICSFINNVLTIAVVSAIALY